MKKYFVGAVATALFGMGGCASPPDEIPTADISTFQFEEMSCDRLTKEYNRKKERGAELHEVLQEEADADKTQAAVGFILWPTWLFLEGGDDARASEYSRLKGEAEAIESVMLDKGCPPPS